MKLIINNVDLTDLLAPEGLEITTKKVDAKGSGLMTIDGVKHYTKLRDADELRATFHALTRAELAAVKTAAKPNTVTATYNDTEAATGDKTATMRCDSVPAGYEARAADGTELYAGVVLTLHE